MNSLLLNKSPIGHNINHRHPRITNRQRKQQIVTIQSSKVHKQQIKANIEKFRNLHSLQRPPQTHLPQSSTPFHNSRRRRQRRTRLPHVQKHFLRKNLGTRQTLSALGTETKIPRVPVPYMHNQFCCRFLTHRHISDAETRLSRHRTKRHLEHCLQNRKPSRFPSGL